MRLGKALLREGLHLLQHRLLKKAWTGNIMLREQVDLETRVLMYPMSSVYRPEESRLIIPLGLEILMG